MLRPHRDLPFVFTVACAFAACTSASPDRSEREDDGNTAGSGGTSQSREGGAGSTSEKSAGGSGGETSSSGGGGGAGTGGKGGSGGTTPSTGGSGGNSSGGAPGTTGGTGGSPSTSPPGACDEAALPHTDLRLWLRADRGITTESDRVTGWTDGSPDARSATAASTGARPQLVANALKGKPIVRFDGMDDMLQVDVPVNGLKTLSIAIVSATTRLWMSDPSEWCGKASENGCSNTYNGPLTWDETGSWGVVHLYPVQTQVTYRFGNGENRDVPEADIKPTYRRPMSIGNAFTRTLAVHDNLRNLIFVDGKQVHTSNAPNGVPEIKNTGAQARIGSGRFDKRWQGDIAEILVWARALDGNESAALERYLACRYAP